MDDFFRLARLRFRPSYAQSATRVFSTGQKMTWYLLTTEGGAILSFRCHKICQTRQNRNGELNLPVWRKGGIKAIGTKAQSIR